MIVMTTFVILSGLYDGIDCNENSQQTLFDTV